MAIGIFRSLEFGGINSADYDVYITGEGVYDAPERSVESVSVPGRNGAILIDNGHFENIEVKYNAGVTGSDQTEFAQKISDFRNAILSQKGYQRLTDEYNPSEYRMASYVSGLEVEATEGEQGTVGEFELVFNCKPQRFLTSGEIPVTVSSGDTIDNPTLFDSSPLLEVEGYGNISFNGFNINLSNAVMGNVEIINGEVMNVASWDIPTKTTVLESQVIPISSYANAGDDFVTSFNITAPLSTLGVKSVKSATISSQPSNGTASAQSAGKSCSLKINGMRLNGTTNANATVSTSCAATVTCVNNLDATVTDTVNMSVTLAFDSSSRKITATSVLTASGGRVVVMKSTEGTIASFSVDSTVSILGHPTYIDCELGECYRETSGTFVSLDGYINLGSQLPVFSPGSNTITCDNTITSLNITPRWWKI